MVLEVDAFEVANHGRYNVVADSELDLKRWQFWICPGDSLLCYGAIPKPFFTTSEFDDDFKLAFSIAVEILRTAHFRDLESILFSR